MEHILIIDDDKELCTLMKKCVEKEGWFAMVAHNGLEGLKFLDEYREGCVLIILDVMMPGIDGFQVLQKIRESSNVPVLMLTAKGDEGDKVFGLRLGADDYLTKPFSISELMARVNSLVRRYTTLNQQESHNQDINGQHLVIRHGSYYQWSWEFFAPCLCTMKTSMICSNSFGLCRLVVWNIFLANL